MGSPNHHDDRDAGDSGWSKKLTVQVHPVIVMGTSSTFPFSHGASPAANSITSSGALPNGHMSSDSQKISSPETSDLSSSDTDSEASCEDLQARDSHSPDTSMESSLVYGGRLSHEASELVNNVLGSQSFGHNDARASEYTFAIPSPALDCGHSLTSAVCTAWSIIIASLERTNEVKLALVGPHGLTGHCDIPIDWTARTQNLSRFMQEHLSISLPNAAHQSIRKVSSESRSGQLSPQTFRIGLPLHTRELYGVTTTSNTYGASTQGLGVENLTIECHILRDQIFLRSLVDASSATAVFLTHISRQLEFIVGKFCSNEGVDSLLGDVKAVSIEELQQIWAWNASVPANANEACIHEIFMRRAQQHPDLLAISAHDGEMTYRGLDDLSTRLAIMLRYRDVHPQQTVLILIEKSKLVPLAQLAVMKHGCASVVLDASLPYQRHQAISQLVQPQIVIASSNYQETAARLGATCAPLILDDYSMNEWPPARPSLLPNVDPSWNCYVVFTSGSTGTPKGAVITHANYASAVATQQKGLDFRENDRVFDFASYAFDAAWCNLIHTMTIGGCLCIPSDEERKGDLAAALRKYQVNYAVLTPSVAWFPASELPASLRTFHFGGEALKQDLVKELSKTATVINAYGPAECSTVSTAIVCNPDLDHDPSIGRGLGCCTWITRVDGSDLAPIGDVGELWIEGPIVGKGYLEEPLKTAAAFVRDPPWLLRGCPAWSTTTDYPGRRGSLYRTGDLVRYSATGDLIFVGRKDSQVKIRGQRVELGEIEYNLARALTDEARAEYVQIVPEVIKLEGSGVDTLVAFIFVAISAGVSRTEADVVLSRALQGLEDRLIEFVPPYMVPSAFLPVNAVPMTPTGKINRKLLRETGPDMYWQQLESQPQSDTDVPQDETQRSICKIWSKVLNLPMSKIGLDSPFTRLGGDSITAMQVVSRCRQENIGIKVADVLRLQTIRSLAIASVPANHHCSQRDMAFKEKEAWVLSPIQQLYFDNQPNNINHYTLSYIIRLTSNASHEALLTALLSLTDRHPMLRARFRRIVEGLGWEQYAAPHGHASFSLEQHQFQDDTQMKHVVDTRQAMLDPIRGPVFAVDVFNKHGEDQTLLMSAHHVVMDLVSWRTVWHDMTQYLSGTPSLPAVNPSFQAWCRLQQEEGKKLDPQRVLPLEISAANFDYWDVTPGTVPFEDSILSLHILDETTTSLLLGSSNDCMRTEILDVLIGTLTFCFWQTFPDRRPPPVFLESHGREPLAEAEDLDLGEIVGWFTSIHPIEIGGSPNSDIFDIIKLAKDNRRRVPSKGRPYFASRYYSEGGRRVFQSHKDIELMFNYRGLFQQLEDVDSMFRLEDRPDRQLLITGDGPQYQRPSLVDMNLVIEEGKLQIWTRSHKPMRNHDLIGSWLASYAETLRIAALQLSESPARYTLADFPLLDISYAGLDTLIRQQLSSQGVRECDIQDIYPCTSMQEGILISTDAGAASYRIGAVWTVCTSDDSNKIDTTRLANSWHTVGRMHPVLSTSFSTDPTTGRFVQVVLSKPNEASCCTANPTESAVQHLGNMQALEPHMGKPHCFFTICTDAEGQVACRLDISHALIDALSLPTLVGDLEKIYSGHAISPRTPFRDVVEHIQLTSSSAKLAYWKEYLTNVEACILPGDLKIPRSSTSAQKMWTTLSPAVTNPVAQASRRLNITRSNFLHIVWSLTLSQITGIKNVCFGYVASGRDLPVDGIETVVGPLLNMLVAHVDLGQSLPRVMSELANYTVEHLGNQHVSLAEIQHEISIRQLFNTNITVRQKRTSSSTSDQGLYLVEAIEEDPHEFDLVLSGVLDDEDTEIAIEYRTDYISHANASAINSLLQDAITFMCSISQSSADGHIGHSEPSTSLLDAYFFYKNGTSEAAVIQAWESQFEGLDATCNFPALPISIGQLNTDGTASYQIENPAWRAEYDASTQLLAAWVLLQTTYTGSADVCVGECTTGDHISKDSHAMQRPLRIKADPEQTVERLLGQVQSLLHTRQNLPELNVERLRLLSAGSSFACDFQTELIFYDITQARTDVFIPQKLTSPLSSMGVPRALRMHITNSPLRSTIFAEFDTRVLGHNQMASLLSQFAAVVRQTCSLLIATSSLAHISRVSDYDLGKISVWNGQDYHSVHACVHDLISRRVQEMPGSLAVSAWDGDLTYKQLDSISDRLAHGLAQLGVRRGVIVPIFFEKSKWVPIAVLAVMKAGGASVTIDHALTPGRIESIVDQVDAQLIILSEVDKSKTTQFRNRQLFVLDQAAIDLCANMYDGRPLPTNTTPSDLLYIVFTSGSTGQPKGVMITHTNFASAIRYQQKALGYRRGHKVYDFASYAFDVSWSNLLHTLTSGSCLYIPSEHEKRNDLTSSIRSSGATLLNATPSMLRTLDPGDFPEIQTVLTSGEPFTEADLGDWMDQKDLINTYGPAECSVKTTITSIVRGMVPNVIGLGYGLKTWIVRTDGFEELAPVGSIGELWLEGPQVGLGYLRDDIKTAKTFVTRPGWLQRSHTSKRYYRTGDLVRYDAAGALIFMGRIDSQVKIRGQRTELLDIEHHIQACLLARGDNFQVVADVFTPHASKNPILVAYMQIDESERRAKLNGLDEALTERVPDYMIPTVYISRTSFPMTASGKTDRRNLRLEYSKKSLEQLVALDTTRGIVVCVPSTEAEKTLQRLWAETLKIDASTISASDSFLRIGGDSLGAMRLVSIARRENIIISVADIFKNPKLNSLARIIAARSSTSEQPSQPEQAVQAFSLLGPSANVEDIKVLAANLCNIEVSDIEDVYPCTPFQEGMMAETLRRPEFGVLNESKALRYGVDLSRLRKAWTETVQANSILRTRIISLDHGLFQVIVRNERCEVEAHISIDKFSLGSPLAQWRISGKSSDAPSSFTWQIHHALYDGFSRPLIFESLCKRYLGEPMQDAASIQSFVRYLGQIDQARVEEYWKDQFTGFDAQKFPALPSRAYLPRCDQRLNVCISNITWPKDYTAASTIRLAWAILLSAITNSTDVSFGTTLSGRDTPYTDVESTTGPTLATVPVRITLDPENMVRDVLEKVQLQAADMLPFQQLGLQNIQKLSVDCSLGCQFQTHMVIQPASEQSGGSIIFEPGSTHDIDQTGENLKTFAINMEFGLGQNNVSLRARYDSNVVPQSQFSRLAERFEGILRQLCSLETQTRPLYTLETSSRTDLQQSWAWNQAVLEACEDTVHGMFARTAARQPDAQAICAHDGSFTYRKLDGLSTQIAHQLIDLGLSQSATRIVPLLFEKSKWTVVCQLAVMKANGTSCGIDAKLPDERLQTILELTSPHIILTSRLQERRARRLASPVARVFVIEENCVARPEQHPEIALPTVKPDTWLYVVFTAGSKGVIISHANITSAFKYQQTILQFSQHTRAYDIAPYASDISWLNILFTLFAGGCLCIPRDQELQNKPHDPIVRMQINTAVVTPTVGRLLRGSGIKIINCIGEILPRNEVDYWQDKATVLHSYGSCECTPIAITHNLDASRQRVVMGKGAGAHTWIIEPDRGEKLVAIGDIGELWLEGPLVGQGYLNNQVKTDAAFVRNPEWLSLGAPGFKGRSGRVYRTGDLVRQEEDGTLSFVGRKDAQVKIRGQRLELEEIAHYVHNAIGMGNARQVVVDMGTPSGFTDEILIAFMEPMNSTVVAGTAHADTVLRQLAASAKKSLGTAMPACMIPKALMLVDRIPQTMTQKIDRLALQGTASSVSKEDLILVGANEKQKREPRTRAESKLQEILAKVLSLEETEFDVDDNFIHIGGDSISAMRFAEAARGSGFSFAVANILTTERLVDLLTISERAIKQAHADTPDERICGSMLDVPDPKSFIALEVMPQLQPGHGKMKDVLHTTHMQDTYLEDNLDVPRTSWQHTHVDFDQTVDVLRLLRSCEQLVKNADIYRTAFVNCIGRYYQVILDSWDGVVSFMDDVDDIDDALEELISKDRKQPIILGMPLAHFHVMRSAGGSIRIVRSMSHAVYDALSRAQTLEVWADLYLDRTPAVQDYARYIRYIGTHKEASYDYWRKTLRGSSMTKLPTNTSEPGVPTVLEHIIPLPTPHAGITQATFFTFACAAALGNLSGSDEIVFGRVVSGRAGVAADLQRVIGPCLNRVPVHINLAVRQGESRLTQLAALQKQYVKSIPHETLGLRDIVQHCTDWPRDTKRFAFFAQYQNVDERLKLSIPGVISAVNHRDTWDVALAADFLEVFAIPEGTDGLKVRVIAGQGFGEGVPRDLLRLVCEQLRI